MNSKILLDKKDGSKPEAFTDMSSQPIIQTSDMGDVMKVGFPESSQDKVRMLGNIHYLEEVAVRGINITSAIGVLPHHCASASNILFQTSVSRFARGREDLVRITSGMQQQEQVRGRSIMDKIMGRNRDNGQI